MARIHGVPVTEDDDANRLGLTDSWASFCMMQYNEEGRASFGRMVDVCQEFVIVDTEDPEIQKSRLVWLELPDAQAREWYERRIAERTIARGLKLPSITTRSATARIIHTATCSK